MNGSNHPEGGRDESAEEMNRLSSQVQMLMEELERLPISPARAMGQECVRALIDFYGLGLERIIQVVKHSGIGGQKACDDMVADLPVSGMLHIHGLHPADIESRLRDALDSIRPSMQSHGGNVELLSQQDEPAPSVAVASELAVRHAIEAACPDLAAFEVEGAEDGGHEEDYKHDFANWEELDAARRVPEGGLMWTAVDQIAIVVCRLDGQLYAYRDRCPACNLPLGKLEAGQIACRAGHRYSVRNAGISPDDPFLYLDPVPLVVKGGIVEVAINLEKSRDAAAAG